MSPRPSRPLSWQEVAVLGLLAFATVLKVVWAFGSEGSADAHLFYLFGKVLVVHPLRDLYTYQALFNHTPFMAAALRALYRACGGDFQSFATAFRFFPIVADIAVVLGLLHVRRCTGRPPWWALGLFAVSPVSIMVSGFHASPDPVMVMFLFFAAIATFHGRPATAGALFCLACNIKAMAILLAPIYLFFWFPRGNRAAVRFAVAAGAGLLAGSAWPLWQCPGPFLGHVLGYGGYWGWWGIPYWLKQTGFESLQRPDFQNLSRAQTLIMTALKLIIIASTLALAWIRRAVEPKDFFGTVAAAFAFLFVFASGAGVHYMVWFAPFLLLLAPEWWAALTAASAIFVFAFYQIGSKDHVFPWISSLIGPGQISAASMWSNVPWLVFVALLVFQGRTWFRVVPAGASCQMDAPAEA